MKIAITRTAWRDLAEIGDYISIDSTKAALAETEKLLSTAYALADQPKAWPLIGRDDIRKRPIGPHLIFYRVTDRIEVLRILHSARDWLSLL